MSQSIEVGNPATEASNPAVTPVVPLNRNLQFSGLVFDPQNLELFREGERVMLQPLPARMLLHLLRNRSRIVSKEEMHDELWPNTFVSDAAISSTLRDLRRAVRDEGQRQAIVRTYRGRGYRFVADVQLDDGYLDSTYQHPSPLELGSSKTPSGFDAPFVGRIHELEFLDRRLRALLRGGVGSLTLVEGMVGSGKSALLDQFSRQTSETIQLRHRCSLELWKPPLATLGELLTRLVEAVDGSHSAEWKGAARLAGTADGAPILGSDAAQGLARLLAAASRHRAITILIDDFQFADEESAVVILGLATQLVDLGVLIVASAEPGLLGSRVEAAAGDLATEDRFALPGLSLTAVERLADSVMAQTPDTTWLRSLHYNTDGCPGATLELLRCAARLEPDPPQAPALPLPDAFSEILKGRLERLSPESQRLVVAATALPPEAGTAALAGVAGLRKVDPEALSPAIRAGWFRTGSWPNRIRLRSPFIRRVVLSAISAERRRQLATRASRLGAEPEGENVVPLEPKPAPHSEPSGDDRGPRSDL